MSIFVRRYFPSSESFHTRTSHDVKIAFFAENGRNLRRQWSENGRKRIADQILFGPQIGLVGLEFFGGENGKLGVESLSEK